MGTAVTSKRHRRWWAGTLAAIVGGASLGLAPTAAHAAVVVEASRVAGADRYATSARVSEEAFPNGADWVVVASGRSFADGLAASALAGRLGAPVLLVPPTGPLPQSIKSELNRLGAVSARIVGGTAAVSAAVENELDARGLSVVRTAGSDRYDTAALVAARIGGPAIGNLRGRRTAFLATGSSFPDALAASAPASSGIHPILLTTPSALSSATSSAIRDLDIEQVVIMGGTGVVGLSVARAIESLGVTVIRVAGVDRGGTARKLADLLVTATPDGFGYPTTDAVIASGLAFPDALSAGPLAGRLRAPILFASPTTSDADAFLTAHRLTIATLTVIGGTAAVTDAQVFVLADAATQPSNQTFAVSPLSPRTWASKAYDSGNAATYQLYTATGIPSDVTRVSITLADPARVHLAADGTVTFDPASGSPTRANLDDPRAGDVRIRAVNGAGVTAATNVANVAVRSDHTVTFRVAVSSVVGIGDVLPVVFEANNGSLLIDGSGRPTGDFAIGGALTARPAEAVTGTTSTVTVWSIGSDSFVGALSGTSGRTFGLRSGDDYRIGGAGGTASSSRAAFLAALSIGDTVVVQYKQQIEHGGSFVANVLDLTDDIVAAPTNLAASTRDSDGNGAVDAVRLTFTAPRTGLQTSGGVKVRRFPVTNGVVGTTGTDVVASWTYTSGTSGQVDLTGSSFPPTGTYVFRVALKGVTGSSFSTFSSPSNTVTISSTGLHSVPTAPVAVAIAVSDSSPSGLDIGDVITVTFNEPVQLTTGTRSIELQDSGGDAASLQSTGPANATFAIGGADGHVLTITATGAPTVTAGSGAVAFGATTKIVSVSTTFRDRDATPQAWNPTPTNTLGAAGAPLGVSTVPGATPVVPFTLAAGGGKITLDHVTNVITGATGAAVPGATVWVSAVGGTGGTATDAASGTAKVTTASASGAFSIALTSATSATTVQLRQEVQRTTTTFLTSAPSASIPAQPSISATSELGGTVDGEMADGDTITLVLTGAMSVAGMTSFDVSVSRASPNVITVKKAGTANVVLTITTTGVRYNDHATDAMTFNGSTGAWSNGNTVLTITLANRAGGSPATVAADHPSSWVAGPSLLDANGVAIDATPVTGAASRF